LDEALKTRGIIGLLVCLNVETQFWFAPHPITISGYAPVRSMLYVDNNFLPKMRKIYVRNTSKGP